MFCMALSLLPYFVYAITKALGGLHECLCSHEPSLLAKNLLCWPTGICSLYTIQNVYAKSEGSGRTPRMFRLV